ncbi:MAG TPA: hypothetical protein VNJ08_10925 [Bacteriovoracaceae bacterium]|nr:hypothetical protein [Bacteriovoracaceae bacterium]
MKTFLMFLIFSSVSHAKEVRFEPEFEKKCFKEVDALKCGSPEGKNQEAFLKCVDSKISKLSEGCQAMHKAIRADSHSGHDH